MARYRLLLVVLLAWADVRCGAVEMMPADAASRATDGAADTAGAADGTDATDDNAPSAIDSLDVATMSDVSLDASDVGDSTTSVVTCTAGGVMGECIDVSLCTGTQHATPGLCPGPANIQCCTSDADAGWCPAVGMPTPNAGLTEAPGLSGCPPGMLRSDTFCVDQFEASLVVDNPDGTTSSWSPYYNPGSMTVRAVSLRDAVPQAYISGVQAAAACAQAGKRLCADTEWLRACQGPMAYTFPYGNTREPGVCNDARAEHPAVQCFNSSACWIWSELTYPGIDQQPDTVALTGSHTGCVTADGAFDMMGNLHEWTANTSGAFRGGYYVDTVVNGPGCLYVTTAHAMDYWDYSTGFRCCTD